MYSAPGAVRSAVADQQIGNEAVMRHRRLDLVGRSRAGIEAFDHRQLNIMIHDAEFVHDSLWYIEPMQLLSLIHI